MDRSFKKEAAEVEKIIQLQEASSEAPEFPSEPPSRKESSNNARRRSSRRQSQEAQEKKEQEESLLERRNQGKMNQAIED